MIEQLSLFPSPAITDPRPPETITWNLWHITAEYRPAAGIAICSGEMKLWGRIRQRYRRRRLSTCQYGSFVQDLTKGYIKCRQVLTSSPASHLISFIKMLMNGGAKHGI
jgi:hypothetical protein